MIPSHLFSMPVRVKTRRTERGDLIDYFFEKLNPEWKGKSKLTHGYIRFRLAKIPTRDLYPLKSAIMDAEHRRESVGKAFWGRIKMSQG